MKPSSIVRLIQNIFASGLLSPAHVSNLYRLGRAIKALPSGESRLGLVRLGLCSLTRLTLRVERVDSWNEDPQWPIAVSDAGAPLIAHFVDALEHTSGVATTVRQWSREAERAGRQLVVHYCCDEEILPGAVRFNSTGRMGLGEYDGLFMHVPNVREVTAWFDAQAFDLVHIATPGPLGLLAFALARQRGLPVCGTYHTDLPRYARLLSGDSRLEDASWAFMRWSYGQMDGIAVPSRATRQDLIEHGFDAGRIGVVGRGVDVANFHPRLRSTRLRSSWGNMHPHKLLYVGRMSKEKNLDTLVGAFLRLQRLRSDVCLVMTGEGPYREELERDLAGLPVTFTGQLHGEDLAQVYASCDLFVFPSRTDTFGVVLIEAQASGVPVVVSSDGGPSECLIPGETGAVVNEINPANLCAAIDSLLASPSAHTRMSEAAREFALRLTPAHAFRAFWHFHDPFLPHKLQEVDVVPIGSQPSVPSHMDLGRPLGA